MSNKYIFFKTALSYQGKIFAHYKQQISLHNRLLTEIQACLPTRLTKHALSCVISENKVLIYTDSAIWSSQLRFYHQTILQTLSSSRLGSFNSLQIKIIPPTAKREIKNSKNQPSQDSINLILDQAEGQSDENLKNALLKLGQTLKKRS